MAPENCLLTSEFFYTKLSALDKYSKNRLEILKLSRNFKWVFGWVFKKSIWVIPKTVFGYSRPKIGCSKWTETFCSRSFKPTIQLFLKKVEFLEKVEFFCELILEFIICLPSTIIYKLIQPIQSSDVGTLKQRFSF